MTTDYKSMTDAELNAALAEATAAKIPLAEAYKRAQDIRDATPEQAAFKKAELAYDAVRGQTASIEYEIRKRGGAARVKALANQLSDMGARGSFTYEGVEYWIEQEDDDA